MNAADPSIFAWPISAESYAWMIGTPTAEHSYAGLPSGTPIPFLVDQVVFRGTERRMPRRYNPLDEVPTLFLEFADIQCTFAEIADFVRRYGPLGGDARVQFGTRWKEKKVRLHGEPFSAWIEGAAEMRLAIELWAIAKGRDDSSATLLEETRDGEIYFDLPPPLGHDATILLPVPEIEALADRRDTDAIVSFWKRQITRDALMPATLDSHILVTSPDHHPERRSIVEASGARAAASIIFIDVVNSALLGRTKPKISRYGSEAGFGQKFQFSLSPRSLLGAMWLQLAMAANDSRNYMRCSSCESWFELAPGLGRPDKTYCSTACRMRAYRRRKAGGPRSAAA
jgi:hypothetical protein